jgi:glutamate-1-semialdehyde 2,1-aminomutase
MLSGKEMEKYKKSIETFERAKKVLIGGVNSPVRSFIAVNSNPIIISKAKGPFLYDIDGNEYIDLICSWGAQILGHANEVIENALKEQIEEGINYGLTSEKEIELAEIICKAIPSIEKVRFVNSGTEATMTAIRLARAYTKKKKIVTFEGCYHGHVDYTLTKAGSGLATYSIAKSDGIPPELIQYTITLKYNSLSDVEEAFKKFGNDIACVILEPIAGNMGVVPAKKEFLEELRYLTEKYNSLLIFDEVITGFRVAYGGAQEIYNIKPDLTCLGKIIGGGLPIGALGGKEEIMNMLTPLGRVYHAGTFSGNPLSMTAGIATLKQLKRESYHQLEKLASKLEKGINDILKENKIPVVSNRVGSMMTFFFTKLSSVENYEHVTSCDLKLFSTFFKELMNNGVLLPPSQFESCFITLSHNEYIIEEIIRRVEISVNKII